MNNDISIFLMQIQKVLNGRVFLLSFKRVKDGFIKDEQCIDKVFRSIYFDKKLLEADITQQEGDFFHIPNTTLDDIDDETFDFLDEAFIEEYQKQYPYETKITRFQKGDLLIQKLDHNEGIEYLVSMLTAQSGLTRQFRSFYNQHLEEKRAWSLVYNFLVAIGDPKSIRFYALNVDSIFQEIYFWDNMGNDSFSAIVNDQSVIFLITNGTD